MAQRIVVAGLALSGLVALFSRPLIGFVLLASALVLFVNVRGGFGNGIFRAATAFLSALWLTLAGAAVTFVGVFDSGCDGHSPSCDDPEGNFLFLPGLMLLAIALTLLAWSISEAFRLRRAARR